MPRQISKGQHTAPCAWMKALLAIAFLAVLLAGFWGRSIQARVNEIRVETAATLAGLNDQIEKLSAEGRENAIATSRVEERLAAIQQSLQRIERELESRRRTHETLLTEKPAP